MFYVLEIQKDTQGNYAHLVHTGGTRHEAEAKYHQVLASAALSQLPLHACTLLTDEGVFLMNGCYRHEAVPDSTAEAGEE